jgi:long-chain acyl-CoA synthetase
VNNDIHFNTLARANPHALAVIDPRHRFWSRAQLAALQNQLSRGFERASLTRGAVVAVVSPNCAEMLAVYLAATQIGLYIVPVNWNLTELEIAHVLRDSDARLIVAHELLDPLLLANILHCAPAVRTHIVIGDAPGYLSLQDFIADKSVDPLDSITPGRLLPYTSAATGRPKAVVLPLSGAAEAVRQSVELNGHGLGPGPHAHLCASMLYHAGTLMAAIASLLMGHLVVLMERWDPQHLLQLIETFRITNTFMAPFMFVALLKLPEDSVRLYCTDSLQRVAHAVAPCPPEVKRRMISWWGPVLWEYYGGAEGGGTMASSQEWLRYPGTVGRPISGSRVKMLDGEGNELPAGAIGLIYLTCRHGERASGEPRLGRFDAIRDEGYFTLGDVGYLNADGYLFVCDREQDVIMTGGARVYPTEVEHVLIDHPSVADCAVFGLPNPTLSEIVCTVVQPAVCVTPSEALSVSLLEFLRQLLPSSKVPRAIVYMDTLPRDPVGYLFRRRLRAMYSNGHAFAR